MPSLNEAMSRFMTLTAQGIMPAHDMDARIDLRRREEEVREVALVLKTQKKLSSKVPAEELASLLGVETGIVIAAAVVANLDVSPHGKVGVSTRLLKKGLL